MSLSTIERLRAWSYDRQRIGDPESTVEQALRAVVAVYATHPTAPLALQVRARSFTAARYRSIDRDRKGIRVPAMRRTIFLVPRKDAARVFTATRASSTHALRPLKRLDLSTEDYEELAKKILTATKVPLSCLLVIDGSNPENNLSKWVTMTWQANPTEGVGHGHGRAARTTGS